MVCRLLVIFEAEGGFRIDPIQVILSFERAKRDGSRRESGRGSKQLFAELRKRCDDCALAMMHEFLTAHRDELIVRCQAKVAERAAPKATKQELEHGILCSSTS